MKQTTVRTLLSRLTEQLLIYFSEDGQISESKEFAERLAIATWEGLILLLRQSIAHSDEVLLEDVGLFRKVDDQWFFEPAASLTEVDALKLPALEEHQYLARKVLFYLNQGTELLANIPADQELSSAAPTAEERLRRTVFGEATDDQKLSSSIGLIADQLTRTAGRLQGRMTVRGRIFAREAEAASSRSYYPYTAADKAIDEYYEEPGKRALRYDLATGKTGEIVYREAPEREPARDIAAAVEAGKKAYLEEKRKTELSGRVENPAVNSEG